MSVSVVGRWTAGQRQTPVLRHAIGAPDASDNDQVRRRRGLFSEGAETRGAKIPGMCRTIGVAQAAKNLAAAGGYCIRILQVSRMFHPASVGVSDAMQSLRSLSRR